MNETQFREYWNEAVLALIYDVHKMNRPIRMADINKCWREELLDRRFFSCGICHGAAVWLQELEKDKPQKALRLREELDAFSFSLGMKPEQIATGIAGVAAAIGGCILLDREGFLTKICGSGVTATGLGLMAKTGKDLLDAVSMEQLCEQIRREANRQLEKLVALL